MSKTIKTVKQVTQAVRDGWDGEDILKNAVTPDGESVKSLISKHSYLKQELEDVEKDIAKFVKVVSQGVRKLDESDDKEDWGFSYKLSGFLCDLAGELGYTDYRNEDGWVNSEY